MKNLLVLIILMTSFFVKADNSLYQELKSDFESKPYFFNDAINDYRNGVPSPFLLKYYSAEDEINNAKPLSEYQLSRIPDAKFIDEEVFNMALKGRNNLLAKGKIKTDSLLAVADFSKHSKERRFYVFDLEKKEVVINFWTSHAGASDSDRDGYADNFSNVPGSNKSSLGFMLTGDTYYGLYGYSRRLIGLDSKLNSKVLSRGVVIHGFGGMGAQEASWSNALATSEGCLMFSMSESGLFWGLDDQAMFEIVINKLVKGSLVFIYSDLEDDKSNLQILNSDWLN